MIVDRDGASEFAGDQCAGAQMYHDQRKAWVDGGGELVSLPQQEQAQMMHMLSSVGDDVSKTKPALREAYQVVTNAANRTRQAPSQ